MDVSSSTSSLSSQLLLPYLYISNWLPLSCVNLFPSGSVSVHGWALDTHSDLHQPPKFDCLYRSYSFHLQLPFLSRPSHISISHLAQTPPRDFLSNYIFFKYIITLLPNMVSTHSGFNSSIKLSMKMSACLLVHGDFLGLCCLCYLLLSCLITHLRLWYLPHLIFGNIPFHFLILLPFGPIPISLATPHSTLLVLLPDLVSSQWIHAGLLFW